MARRDPTGLAPDPATNPEPVIQVYAARAVSWRGVFAVHTWIAVKPAGAARYTRYEVLGFGVANGAPAVRVDRMGPDNYWFGARPRLVLDRRGPGVDAMIDKIRAAVASYPYPHEYRAWPGPNSNTFTAYVARQVPELGLDLAVERDRQGFPAGRRAVCGVAPSGTGVPGCRSTALPGILVAVKEGVELNLLGPQCRPRLRRAGAEIAGGRRARLPHLTPSRPRRRRAISGKCAHRRRESRCRGVDWGGCAGSTGCSSRAFNQASLSDTRACSNS